MTRALITRALWTPALATVLVIGAGQAWTRTSAAPAEEGRVADEASRGTARAERYDDYREVTIPAGTVLPLRLTSRVASDASRIEDPVHATLRRTIIVRGIGALPAGTAVSGDVTEATRSARVKGRARIGFRFHTLTTGGESYRVSTSSVVRQAPGTKKKDAAKIGIPAAAGAIIGGIADGKKGAAIGGAIGGGGGTAVVMSTRGQEVRLGRGALVAVRLLQPLTVRVPRIDR